MAQEVGIEAVYAAIEDAFRVEDLNKIDGLLQPALDQFPELGRFWFYAGCLYFKRGHCAMAATCFERSIDLDDAVHIYSNLAACLRRMNLNERGLSVLERALERNPNYPPALVNYGSMWVNEGQPERGIPALELAVKTSDESGAVWNLGLLYLEAARFGEGFDHYREGITRERPVRKYGATEHGIPEPAQLTMETWSSAVESGSRPRLIVWGEQGIGDELMFSSVIKDARAHFDISFECHPRLEKLHRNAHPGLPLYPTRKEEWIQWPVLEKQTFDFKCPVGDLAGYYRRDHAAFVDAFKRNGPTYHANPVEVARYRDQLQAMAEGRPIIGLATRGGVMQTSRTYRTVRNAEIDRLMAETNAMFVALDYDDILPLANYITEKHGAERFRWFPSISQHWDYDHTAALIGATDMVVTVCQSVFHMAGGMAHPCRVLTPIRCAWRYARINDHPDQSYWYPSPEVRLYRQDDPGSWDHPIARVVADINALEQKQAAA